MAWGLLALAAGAFSLILVVIAGVVGYLNGQGEVDTLVEGTKQAQISQYLTEVPTRIAEGNAAYIEGYIDWFGELTPAPPELAGLIATGTQFALDRQPTATPTPTNTPPATPTPAPPTSTPPPAATSAPTQSAPAADDADAPLFDAAVLFAEAQAQMSAGEYEEAARTLDAVMAVDPAFRADEVQALMLQALTQQATLLLRSGETADLSAGIVKANEAEAYGDIGDLAYERYIAGLYLNAQSKEGTNPEGAIEGYSQIYAQTPNYLDVRTKLFNLRVELGNVYYEALDFCPAVVQYQAALQIVTAPDIEAKLETAQSSCSGGAPPTNVTPGTPGDTSAPAATPTPAGVAPIGERP